MFTLKRQVKDSQDRKSGVKSKATPGQLRAQKDISQLDLPSSIVVKFPDPDDVLHLNVILSPEEGLYMGGSFPFSITIPPDYPHKPPKVHCDATVYHPNIDLEGNVCLNILRQDWKPILTLNSVLYGLQLLFLEPNPDDPLNKDAAEMFLKNQSLFERWVRVSMAGGSINNTHFTKVT